MQVFIFHISTLSAGIDFRRQSLTSMDVRLWHLKSNSALKEWNILVLPNNLSDVEEQFATQFWAYATQ